MRTAREVREVGGLHKKGNKGAVWGDVPMAASRRSAGTPHAEMWVSPPAPRPAPRSSAGAVARGTPAQAGGGDGDGGGGTSLPRT